MAEHASAGALPVLLPPLPLQRDHRAHHQLLREQPGALLQCAQPAQLPAQPGVFQHDGQRALPQPPSGPAEPAREPPAEAYLRRRVLTALPVHPVHPHPDHRNHRDQDYHAGTGVLPPETERTERQGILLHQVPLHEGERPGRHPAGHQGRPPQDPLGKHHAQDQHRRAAPVHQRTAGRHEHSGPAPAHAEAYRRIFTADRQVYGTPLRETGYHRLEPGYRLPG